jgi:protoporphyrinogen oxidase
MKLKEILLNFVDKIKKSIDNFEIILKDSGKKQAQYVMLTSKFYQVKRLLFLE